MNVDKNVPGAIILGGNFVGLGIVRSLGSRGIRVWVLDAERSKSIAQFSRYTERFIEAPEGVLDLLLREGREHKLEGWVVFPVTDEYVELVSANYEALSSIYRLTTPPWQTTKFALDKRLTYARADDLQISTPWTLMSKSLEDLETKDLPYPVILKPAVNHHFFPQTNVKVLPVANASNLHARYAQMAQYIPAEEILVQEHIPGGGERQFSYCGACESGQVSAWLVAQRRRQYPLEFGNASSFVETVDNSAVEAAARQFLESIRFDGVAEVEFKFDSRDGKYKILDVNPRIWGWHTLGKAAGIDFAYFLWRQKVGLASVPVEPQRNAAWLREITDIVAILKSPDKLAELKKILHAMRVGKLELATFDLRDPIPFFAEFALWFAGGLSRQKRAKTVLNAATVPVQLHGE